MKFRMLVPAVLINFPSSKVCLIGEWSIVDRLDLVNGWKICAWVHQLEFNAGDVTSVIHEHKFNAGACYSTFIQWRVENSRVN